MFRCYSYTIIREDINALPDDGVTLTPKHVRALFNVNFNIVFF